MDESRQAQQQRQTQWQDREWVVVEEPIPPRRALAPRGPLALLLGSSATIVAIGMLAVLGAGSAATTGALPLAPLQSGAASVQANPAGSAPQEPSEAAQDTQNKKSTLPSLLQSRSADSALPLVTRPDGRTALSNSPAVLVVYVPDGYYPQPATAKPPTKEAAQQTANIVQQIATGNEAKAVDQAKALQSAQPKYAADLANDLQKVTQDTPRYNTVRQVLIQLDPDLVTRTQVQTQTQTQAQTQTQTQTQTQAQTSTQNQAQTNTQQSNQVPQTRTNPTDKAAKVNALVMSTVPAYMKMPLGLNEGTLQVNTMVAPTPAFLFDQAQIKAALCEIGNGEVVNVYDSVPAAWELKTTFVPRDPVRWFGVKDANGKIFYLPNYLDPVRDVQVGDRFTVKSGCNVELVKR